MTVPLTDDRLAARKSSGTSTIAAAIRTFPVRLDDAGFMAGAVQCRYPPAGPMVGHAVSARIRIPQAIAASVPLAAEMARSGGRMIVAACQAPAVTVAMSGKSVGGTDSDAQLALDAYHP
jgi:hypothetical protein